MMVHSCLCLPQCMNTVGLTCLNHMFNLRCNALMRPLLCFPFKWSQINQYFSSCSPYYLRAVSPLPVREMIPTHLCLTKSHCSYPSLPLGSTHNAEEDMSLWKEPFLFYTNIFTDVHIFFCLQRKSETNLRHEICFQMPITKRAARMDGDHCSGAGYARWTEDVYCFSLSVSILRPALTIYTDISWKIHPFSLLCD